MSGARPQRDAVVTIRIPFAVRKRGGRKLVLAPDGAPIPPAAPQVDSTLVKAIARAFRWQKVAGDWSLRDHSGDRQGRSGSIRPTSAGC